jgi:G3E family GTPase
LRVSSNYLFKICGDMCSMKVIPLTILTGFLGSGKSTFINKVLADNPRKKIGLIVNEFGDVKLESQIINSELSEEIVELSNGCMCCVVRGDLVKAVEKMIDARVDYIFIEASGLSDPIPIAQTFTSHALDKRVRLDAILCIVDVVNIEQNLKNFVIVSGQLTSADIILLSKTDLVEPEKVKQITQFISQYVHDAQVIDLSVIQHTGELLDTSEFDHSVFEEMEHAHSHEKVQTIFFKSKQPLDYQAFSDCIFKYRVDIVRAKGFIDFGESVPQPGKYILQFVGTRKQLIVRSWASDEQHQTAIVFIGKKIPQAFKEELKQCVKK